MQKKLVFIDREMKHKELTAKAGITPSTLAKMRKDGTTVSSDLLVRICAAADCTFDDIVEIVRMNGLRCSILSEIERSDEILKEGVIL